MKRERILVYSLLMASAMAMQSCATLLTGTSDRIAFNTTPPGALVIIDGIDQCRTPCTVKVKRAMDDKEAEFKLDGYQTRVITLSKEFNTISVLNLGNLLGWAIDAVTGAVFKYDKKSYDITLDSNRKTSYLDPVRIEIDTKMKTADFYITEAN
jgi:PEGA domain